MDNRETYCHLCAAAAEGNAADLRKLTGISADMAADALQILLPLLWHERTVQESPQLLRGYAECVKTLFDWGADARSFTVRSFREGDIPWLSAQAYRTLCLTVTENIATPYDAEFVALMAHIEMYHCAALKGCLSHRQATEALGCPTEWRRTMRRAAPIFAGINDG